MNNNLTTTVNIVIPPAAQEHVGRLHRQYQPDRPMLVPAHFSVLHPFVDFAKLDEGLDRLRRVCASLRPSEIVIDGYDTFPGVVFLTARDQEPIRVVSRALCAEFPECPLYGGEFGPELHAHAAIIIGNAGAEAVVHEIPPYEPIGFTARELHVYYGNDEIVPWLTAAIIPLGTASA